jgi:SAM hydroxide adenosyltransferase C-terminal domain
MPAVPPTPPTPQPPVVHITDCFDPNATARLTVRLATLFGQNPAVLPLTGADPEGTAALTLLDVLRATEHLGSAGEPVVVLVNIAPRDGAWPNGVPFGYFHHGRTLVVTTLGDRVLSLVREYLGVTEIHVTDVRTTLEAAAADWADFSREEIEEIADSQFRSMWYQPLLAKWVHDGRPIPHTTRSIGAVDQEDVRVAVIDNFGNCKLDRPATAIAGYAASRTVQVRDLTDGKLHDVQCHRRLTEVPHGVPALTVGSSGFGFAELVIRGESAAERFGLYEGAVISVLRSS